MALPSDALAEGAPVMQATDAQKANAKDHFLKAKDAFQNKRLAEALKESRASYAIVASPNAHIMVAQVLDSMGKQDEAYVEALSVETEARSLATNEPKYGDTADAARKLADALRPQLGMVVVKVPGGAAPGSKLIVAGREVPQSSWGHPFPVRPGKITVVFGGGAPKSVTVTAGGHAEVDFQVAATAAPLPITPPPMTTPVVPEE